MGFKRIFGQFRRASSATADPITQPDPPRPDSATSGRTNEPSRPSSSNKSLLKRTVSPSSAVFPSTISISDERKDETTLKQKDPSVTSEGASTAGSKGLIPTPLEGSVTSSAPPDFTVEIEEPTPGSTIEEPHSVHESQAILESIEERDTLYAARPVAHTTLKPPDPSDHTYAMTTRKIWVRRPGAAATMVVVRVDDLVDEAKETILKKYGNSLGRHYDAPDITLRVVPREHPVESILSPDENLCRALDKAYPGQQTIEEALIIHIPPRRTPKHSPGGVIHHHHGAHTSYYHPEEGRPLENGTEYFPPMPLPAGSPSISLTHDARQNYPPSERSMSVLNTGQIPPLVSPGGSRRLHTTHKTRPGVARQATVSPAALTSAASSRASRPRLESTGSAEKHVPLAVPALPTPPIPEMPQQIRANTPPPRVSSPRPSKQRKARQKPVQEMPPPVPSFVDTAVPPINVLIVEDNMINMKLLEQFVRRLKVHWATAVNGREAVQKWRQGGFHLVLMDIQLPIMSGLEATREIRRLERVNDIGVLSSTASEVAPAEPQEGDGETKDEDKLGDAGRLFKSPVIIVALTASNLQSDRHEALAAGCNDFLTKPVNFVWFERKVKEWGCMQALIDFDGWRKWKDAAVQNGLKDASNPRPAVPKKKLPEPAKTEPAKTEPGPDEKPSSAVTTGPSLEGLKGSRIEDQIIKEESPDTVIAMG